MEFTVSLRDFPVLSQISGETKFLLGGHITEFGKGDDIEVFVSDSGGFSGELIGFVTDGDVDFMSSTEKSSDCKFESSSEVANGIIGFFYVNSESGERVDGCESGGGEYKVGSLVRHC